MHLRAAVILTFALVLAAASANVVFAATGTITPPYQYAWDDNGGYVNWDATGSNVTITDTSLTGYIWSAGFGWINLAPTLGGVMNASGTLAGFAWGANTGWIDFTGVTIDSNGVFHGHTTAQSTFGTMTFDCTYCTVITSWHAPYVPSPPSSSTSSGGNGPPLSGPLSFGYVTSFLTPPEQGNIAPVATTSIPASLIPTSPPPRINPTTKPPSTPSHPVRRQNSPQPVTQPAQPQAATTSAASPPTAPITQAAANPSANQPTVQPTPSIPAAPLPPSCTLFTCWLQGLWHFLSSLF